MYMCTCMYVYLWTKVSPNNHTAAAIPITVMITLYATTLHSNSSTAVYTVCTVHVCTPCTWLRLHSVKGAIHWFQDLDLENFQAGMVLYKQIQLPLPNAACYCTYTWLANSATCMFHHIEPAGWWTGKHLVIGFWSTKYGQSYACTTTVRRQHCTITLRQRCIIWSVGMPGRNQIFLLTLKAQFDLITISRFSFPLYMGTKYTGRPACVCMCLLEHAYLYMHACMHMGPFR